MAKFEVLLAGSNVKTVEADSFLVQSTGELEFYSTDPKTGEKQIHTVYARGCWWSITEIKDGTR